MDKTFKDNNILKTVNDVKKNEKNLINFYKKDFVKYHNDFSKVYNNYLDSLKQIDEKIENFNSLQPSIKQNIPTSLKPANIKIKDIDNFVSPSNNLLLNSYSLDQYTTVKEFIKQHLKNQISYYMNKNFKQLNSIISSYDILIGRDLNVHGKNSEVDYIENIDFRKNDELNDKEKNKVQIKIYLKENRNTFYFDLIHKQFKIANTQL